MCWRFEVTQAQSAATSNTSRRLAARYGSSSCYSPARILTLFSLFGRGTALSVPLNTLSNPLLVPTERGSETTKFERSSIALGDMVNTVSGMRLQIRAVCVLVSLCDKCIHSVVDMQPRRDACKNVEHTVSATNPYPIIPKGQKKLPWVRGVAHIELETFYNLKSVSIR